jgi:hypothetical protein
MKQLVNLHERQGSSKPAAAGWIGAVYALRAASRLDANKEWGKLGDEIISHLEQAYLSVMGPEAAKPVEVGRKLLQTQRKPDLGPMNIPSVSSRPAGAERPRSGGSRAAVKAVPRTGAPTARPRTARRAR